MVVGVDGSPDGSSAVRWAERYALATGATLRLVSTWMWPVSYGGVAVYEGFDPDALSLEIVEKAKADLTLPPDRVTTVCLQSAAGPALVSQCDDAQLLVVGTRGHSGISTILLGSVSSYCVHHAPCPVVVVR